MESRNKVADARAVLSNLSADKLAELLRIMGEVEQESQEEPVVVTAELWCHFTYSSDPRGEVIASLRCGRGYTASQGTLAFRGTGRHDADIDGGPKRLTFNAQAYVEGSQSDAGKAAAEAKRRERAQKQREYEDKQLAKAKAILARREQTN